MTHWQTRAIAAIEEQQKKEREGSPVWTVGEQLKEIVRAEPQNAELVAEDLAVLEMSLAKCERKIKAFADKQQRAGGCVCVTPHQAETVIREFYGLTTSQEPAGAGGTRRDPGGRGAAINLEDFL